MTNRMNAQTEKNRRIAGGARDEAGARRALDLARKCVVIFATISVVVLVIVVAMAVTREAVNTFMWVRAGILIAVGPVLYRLTVRAAEGGRRSFERLRVVSLVLPIAIVVVDLIPGVCPLWYATMQAVSVIPLVAVAIITRRAPLTATFPTNAGRR